MIAAQHLVKKFGNTTAVNDVSFTVAEGENLVLLGTSGCGKTTTLRMLNRLTEPDSGRITIRGNDVKSEPPEILRRSIGYVMQQNGLFPHYTVEENIAVVPHLLKWEKDKIKERVKTLLAKLNLSYEQHGQMFPHELSGDNNSA
ncbi:ATP-binding cassette domain-containing protein [Chitinophaga sedimenti]|nr:ATP-binding cassette domain-containing protein [Chitinophaga sedimenti]MCK7559500.1 ATP-binding cassette domain-containing protein [Chitinophaga sedimenti]